MILVNTMAAMSDDDFIVYVPKALVGDSEPGDLFPLPFITWLKQMVNANMYPVDFGSADGTTHIELWMKRARHPDQARKATLHFIEVGGDV